MLIKPNIKGVLLNNGKEDSHKNTMQVGSENFVCSQNQNIINPSSNNYRAFYMPTLSFGRDSDKILRIGPVEMAVLGQKHIYAYPRLFTSSLRMPTDEDLKTGNLAFTDLTNLTKEQIKKINFKKANLVGANMSGLDLSEKEFEFACLVFADLSNTNLTNANLQHTDMSNSQLINSNLTGTNFSGSDLKMATLSKAYNNDVNNTTKFDHAYLGFACFVDTKLPNSSFKNSCMYKIKVNGGDLSNSIFEDTDLTGAHINHNSSLNNCKFLRANLTNSLLIESSLTKAFIQASNLSRMLCSDSNLTESTIYTSLISDTKFKNNKLIKMKFENNILTISDFQNNDFTDATLNGSVFMDCRFKDNTIADAKIDEAKIFNSNQSYKMQQLGKQSNINNLESDDAQTQASDIVIDYSIIKPSKSTPSQPSGFDKVAGMESVKDLFRKNVINIIRYPELAKSHNARIPNGTILYGPGGCGKTFIINALVEEISKIVNKEVPLISMENTESVYQHGTAQIIGKYFNKAKKLAQKYGICVVSIDEAERFLLSRNVEGRHSHNIEETDKMLSQLNELSQHGVYIIATTNHIDMLDKSATRTGRFDHKVAISLPTIEALKDALVIEFNKNPSAKNLVNQIKNGNCNDLLLNLKDATFSDTTAIAEYANALSFNEAIEAKDKSPNAEDVTTNYEHLKKAVDFIMAQQVNKSNKNTSYNKTNIGFLTDHDSNIF